MQSPRRQRAAGIRSSSRGSEIGGSWLRALGTGELFRELQAGGPASAFTLSKVMEANQGAPPTCSRKWNFMKPPRHSLNYPCWLLLEELKSWDRENTVHKVQKSFISSLLDRTDAKGPLRRWETAWGMCYEDAGVRVPGLQPKEPWAVLITRQLPSASTDLRSRGLASEDHGAHTRCWVK